MTKKTIYFVNLNGLRFIAVLMVLFHHIEQFKLIFNLENYFTSIRAIALMGKLGVVLFFVLSGFLITYLLLAEESISKKINVKHFYIRRILRIWPLYFLILLIAFFILPNIDLFKINDISKEVIYSDLTNKLLLFLFFLPNLAIVIYGGIPYASHTWSIGTEEQFYLIWPILIKTFKRNRLKLLFFVILIYLTIKLILISPLATHIPFNIIIKNFWDTFLIDCMAIGAIFSVLLFQKHKFLKFLIRNDLFYFSILLVLIVMLIGINIPFLYYEFFAFFFGIIILNFAVNKNIGFSLENKYMNFLGKISYSMYMFHSIAIVLTIKLLSMFGIISNWFIYPLSVIITIVISSLSYQYFEKYFLKSKSNFSLIRSGLKSRSEKAM